VKYNIDACFFFNQSQHNYVLYYIDNNTFYLFDTKNPPFF